jgi:hypothetical protein
LRLAGRSEGLKESTDTVGVILCIRPLDDVPVVIDVPGLAIGTDRETHRQRPFPTNQTQAQTQTDADTGTGFRV